MMNSGGFYDHLANHIRVMQDQGFLYERAIKRITIVKDPQELADHL